MRVPPELASRMEPRTYFGVVPCLSMKHAGSRTTAPYVSITYRRRGQDMGSRFPEFLNKLGNLFPSLLFLVPLEQRVKGFPVHACFPRGSTDVSAAAGQQRICVRALKSCQILFPGLLPRES